MGWQPSQLRALVAVRSKRIYQSLGQIVTARGNRERKTAAENSAPKCHLQDRIREAHSTAPLPCPTAFKTQQEYGQW